MDEENQPVEEVEVNEVEVEETQEVEATHEGGESEEPEEPTEPAPEAETDNNKSKEERIKGFEHRQRQKLAKLERENELLRQRTQERELQEQPMQQHGQSFGDFDDPDDWMDAKIRQREALRQREIEAQRQAEAQRELSLKIAENEAEYAKNNPDYYEDMELAFDQMATLDPLVRQAIVTSNVAPALGHKFALSDNLISRFRRMNPVQAIKEIAELERSVKSKSSVSKAHAPINSKNKKQVSATSATASSYSDFVKARRAE